jgi:hypothetical protein
VWREREGEAKRGKQTERERERERERDFLQEVAPAVVEVSESGLLWLASWRPRNTNGCNLKADRLELKEDPLFQFKYAGRKSQCPRLQDVRQEDCFLILGRASLSVLFSIHLIG